MAVDLNARILETADARAKAAEGAGKKTNSIASAVDMDFFFKMLMAQIQNQDPMQPMDSDQMLSQMADLANVQALNDVSEGMKALLEMTNTSYATSLVGKQVTVATVDKDNNLKTETGIVTAVGLYDTEYIVFVNGKEYKLSEIMAIGDVSGGTTDKPVTDKPEAQKPETEGNGGVTENGGATDSTEGNDAVTENGGATDSTEGDDAVTENGGATDSTEGDDAVTENGGATDSTEGDGAVTENGGVTDSTEGNDEATVDTESESSVEQNITEL